jgi:hypothetical protein
MKKSLERCRSAGFQPATPLNSIEADKMLAPHWASGDFFISLPGELPEVGSQAEPHSSLQADVPPGADLF